MAGGVCRRNGHAVDPTSLNKRKPATTVVRARPLTSKAVGWTVLPPPGKRDELDAAMIESLRAHSPASAELTDLAEAFTSLNRNRSADKLDPWLRRDQDGASPVLRCFAEKFPNDSGAVRAAVTLPWATARSRDRSMDKSPHSVRRCVRVTHHTFGLKQRGSGPTYTFVQRAPEQAYELAPIQS